jgi:predicted PurR-regulated permease PerM
MKRCFLSLVVAATLLFSSGCGNLSPRVDPKLDQKIDNQNGKIDEIKNNQNGIMGEIGTLKNQAEIQNSQLDKIQQGMFNLQSNSDNHGVQIFSGTGGLMLAAVFGVIIQIVLIFHYRSKAQMHEKTANILAERIVNRGDPELENAVFEAVLHTPVAENTLNIFRRQKSLLGAKSRT